MATSAPGGSRVILRRLREIMAAGDDVQTRLDRLVAMIASTMVADVCSIYLRRGETLELFATLGLRAEAVHRTRLQLMEGLVGLVAESGRPLNIADAPHHPRFSYRPETGEDPYNAFLGVPVLRSDRVFGVLVVQNRVAKTYDEDEVEALQTIAMVLAEMVAGLSHDRTFLAEVEVRLSRPERLMGRAFSDGTAIGLAVLHEPHAPLGRMIADDPALESARLEGALQSVRQGLDAMLEGDGGRLSGASREVLETFRLLAQDRSWEQRLQEGIGAGLSAEAAVERARQQHRAKLASVRDPYLRDRLHDLEDLDNRLLRALAQSGGLGKAELPANAILIARDLGPAELLEYGNDRLKGIALEEGGPSSHAVIVARALGIPMIGRLHGLLRMIETGDVITLDSEQGEVHLRPRAEVLAAMQQRQAMQSEQAAELAKLRDLPARTLDGHQICLSINAGLALDLRNLEGAGAEGVGLFRTEFQFMVSETLPRLRAQTKLYAEILDLAGRRPVTFRTLDIGGDKILPYVTAEREDNPALGWRALRIGLDRPALLRYQLRALVEAADARALRVMFPLVATIEEFEAARAFMQRELELAYRKGRAGPSSLEIGAMLEAPALGFAIDQLAGRADFLSIGTNDLMQYFFAADRGNARVSDRYDLLSLPALRFLRQISRDAAAANLPISICGEAAGKTLEAMAFLALGFERLSMPAGRVAPVRRMVRSLDRGAASAALNALLDAPGTPLRQGLLTFAQGAAVML